MAAMKVLFTIASCLSAIFVPLGFLLADSANSGSGNRTNAIDAQNMIQGGGMLAIAFAVLAIAMAVGEATARRAYALTPMPGPQYQPPGGGYPR